MQAKHTPAPWVAEEKPHWGQPGIDVITPRGAINVYIPGPSASCADFDGDGVDEYVPVEYDGGSTNYHEPGALEEAQANARLIAAAPDMYEALRGLAAICMPPSGAPAYHDSEWVTVRAALAKAEGR